MSQTAITLAFEQHLANLQMGSQPVIPDEFVLAHVPGLDLSAPIDRAAGLPPAGQIVHRQAVDQRGKVNANGVAYSIIMDTRIGDFTFNAMYLLHKASGLVAMVVHKAAEDKLKNQTNRPGNSLVKSMLMEYQGAAEATNTQVDASTWQIDFSSRLLGLDRDVQQQAHDHYGDAAFIADGFAVRPGQGVNEFMVAAGLGYIAGLRTELAAEQSVTVSQRPATLYADVYHAGTLLSDWHTQVEIKASSIPLADYTDEAGYPHYVTPLATLAANGAVTDLRGRGGLWWHEQGPQAHTKDQVGLNKLENWSWSHSYTDTTGGATKYASGKAVADAYNALNNSKLNASSYTAADVLAKLKTVDGANSGLDADLLDGQHGAYYRAWANLTGVPATASRWPSFAEVTGKPATYPPSNHTHDDRYYTKAQGDGRYAGIARDIKNATALGTSALNTITEPGFYYQHQNANASTARNYPVLLAGTLIVTEAAGVVQTYIPYGTPGIIYTRGYYGSSWSGWAATYSTANKPSSADVGLSNLQNWSYSHSYTDATGGATKYASGKAVADGYNKLNSNKLDKTGKAADSAKLNGQLASFYLAWANLTGVPATFPPSAHGHAVGDISGLQFAPYDPNRTYSTGETCTTVVGGELKIWEMYAGPNKTCKGKDPNLTTNRHDGWASSTAPFWWIEYGNMPGRPAYWLAETAPERAVMEMGQNLPVAVYWRLARQYPHLVNGSIINTGDIRGEFLRVWDNGRGVDAARLVNSAQLDSMQKIIGSFGMLPAGATAGLVYGSAGAFYGSGTLPDAVIPNKGASSRNQTVHFDSSRVVRAGEETRPRNISRAMIIEI